MNTKNWTPDAERTRRANEDDTTRRELQLSFQRTCECMQLCGHSSSNGHSNSASFSQKPRNSRNTIWRDAEKGDQAPIAPSPLTNIERADMTILTTNEINELCSGLTQHAAQVRFLKGLGLTVSGKPNGAPIVSRSHFDSVTSRGNVTSTVGRQDGPRWGVH